jgi:hypothetical protein
LLGNNAAITAFRKRLITKLPYSLNGTLAALPSTIHVASPVDLVLTDQVTGQRYVTSEVLYREGDILLAKVAVDLVASADSVENQDYDPQFPPYSVTLPFAAYGHSLDVTIVGIGDGSFEIVYQQRDTLFSPPARISGSVTNGQSINGEFAVLPPGESAIPRITSFTRIGANQFRIDWSPATTVNVQFSPDLEAGSWQTLGTVNTGTSWEGSVPAPAPQKGFFKLETP